jgi:hypothetical protein
MPLQFVSTDAVVFGWNFTALTNTFPSRFDVPSVVQVLQSYKTLWEFNLISFFNLFVILLCKAGVLFLRVISILLSGRQNADRYLGAFWMSGEANVVKAESKTYDPHACKRARLCAEYTREQNRAEHNRNVVLIQSNSLFVVQSDFGHTVAQLVEALHYQLEGCGFDSRWYHWNFPLT